MQSTPLKHRKISPLQLLSKVRKSQKFYPKIDLSNIFIVNNKKNKPNRFVTQVKSQQSLPEIKPQPIIKVQDSSDKLKISDGKTKLKSQKSQSSNFRYYSVQKQKTNKNSPYQLPMKKNAQNLQVMANIRKRISMQKNNKNKSLLFNNIRESSMKNMKQSVKWIPTRDERLKYYCTSHYKIIRQIHEQINRQKFFHEFIVEKIRKYILQENDSSQLQNLYVGDQNKNIIRKIIYFQRVLVLLLAQSLISKRLKTQFHSFHGLFNHYHQFYSSVLAEFASEIQQDEGNKKKQQSLTSGHLQIQAKLKILMRQSKWLGFVNKEIQKIKICPPNLLFYKLLEQFSIFLLKEDCLGLGLQFLQTCPSPYLHYQTEKLYTLVLDMDETLIHYKMTSSYQGQFLIRPYVYDFLKNLSPYYQIGIFTCSLPQYADIILNHFQHISFRLYRHHTVQINGQYIKDLSRIGRDLNKLILVDNLDKNFRLQKQNGIHIKSWYGNKKDKQLLSLEEQLLKIASKKPCDIRESDHRRSFL